MPRYRVIVTGTGMNIPPEGWIGFATTRFVRAGSMAEAAVSAISLVKGSVASEPAFSTSNPPELDVDDVFRVWSPFKLSRPNAGFTFVGPGEELADALDIERKAGEGWFL